MNVAINRIYRKNSNSIQQQIPCIPIQKLMLSIYAERTELMEYRSHEMEPRSWSLQMRCGPEFEIRPHQWGMAISATCSYKSITTTHEPTSLPSWHPYSQTHHSTGLQDISPFIVTQAPSSYCVPLKEYPLRDRNFIFSSYFSIQKGFTRENEK